MSISIEYADCKPICLTADIPYKIAQDWRNDSKIWKWCRQFTLISEEEQEMWWQAQVRDPSVKMFGVGQFKDKTSAGDGVYVGVCGFTSIDFRNRNAEFSLYINPEYQGAGFGGKALLTLIRHGFEDFGFNRIWGEVFEGNPALAVFEGLGFRREGVLKESYFKWGRFIDSHMVGITAAEFFESEKRRPRLVEVEDDGNNAG